MRLKHATPSCNSTCEVRERARRMSDNSHMRAGPFAGALSALSLGFIEGLRCRQNLVS